MCTKSQKLLDTFWSLFWTHCGHMLEIILQKDLTCHGGNVRHLMLTLGKNCQALLTREIEIEDWCCSYGKKNSCFSHHNYNPNLQSQSHV